MLKMPTRHPTSLLLITTGAWGNGKNDPVNKVKRGETLRIMKTTSFTISMHLYISLWPEYLICEGNASVSWLKLTHDGTLPT